MKKEAIEALFFAAYKLTLKLLLLWLFVSVLVAAAKVGLLVAVALAGTS